MAQPKFGMYVCSTCVRDAIVICAVLMVSYAENVPDQRSVNKLHSSWMQSAHMQNTTDTTIQVMKIY